MKRGTRGYFGIGVEGVSKPMNVGTLMRSAHAFGAKFVFTVNAAYSMKESASDTSRTPNHVPLYRFDHPDDLMLPDGCSLVGIEITDDAIDLPSFPHPLAAAYILGPERGALSPSVIARCSHVVRIPTLFSINLGIAGAIVMYDRILNLGRFAERPLNPRAKPTPRPPHVFGEPLQRKRDTP